MTAGVQSLTAGQSKALQELRQFAETEIVPFAGGWDRAGRLPRSVVDAMAAAGHLGALIPAEYGGSASDLVDFGLLNEAIGYGCSSVRSVLTVHSMICQAVTRWGSAAQRQRWLPRLATGRWVGAFALSEPEAGSDAGRIATTATPDGDHYVLDGTKKWITYGQAADVFLVFAGAGGRCSAFLVERDTPGLTVAALDDMLGTRASMLAQLHFEGCRVPRQALLGRPGFGLAAVWMAKYFASTAAGRAAADTVQIHGARGCDPAGAAQRFFRDAKVLEIIEGSTQIQQTTIAQLVLQTV